VNEEHSKLDGHSAVTNEQFVRQPRRPVAEFPRGSPWRSFSRAAMADSRSSDSKQQLQLKDGSRYDRKINRMSMPPVIRWLPFGAKTQFGRLARSKQKLVSAEFSDVSSRSRLGRFRAHPWPDVPLIFLACCLIFMISNIALVPISRAKPLLFGDIGLTPGKRWRHDAELGYLFSNFTNLL